MSSIEQDSSSRLGQVLLGKYTIERLVGSGGMATVYAARNGEGKFVALKMLHPEMSEREDVRERFRREGYAANRVKHPGTVPIIDDEVAEDGSAFLVMELLEGESLTARANRQVVDTKDLLAWVDEILDVLAAYHAEDIVHRDLKPDNIFLTADGHVKLLDFGIARVNDLVPNSFKTRVGTVIGTAPYMAPEQALGKVAGEIDGRADLFSIGATMFRLIARRKIHEVESDADMLVAMATLPAPPLSSVAKDAPKPVCDVVDRALAFLQSRRYPDAQTMQEDVRAVLRGVEPPYASALLAQGNAPWVKHEPAKNAVERTVVETGVERRIEPTALDMPAVPLPAATPALGPADAAPPGPASVDRPPPVAATVAFSRDPPGAPPVTSVPAPEERMAPPRPSPTGASSSRRLPKIVPQPVVAVEPNVAPPAPALPNEPFLTPPPDATAFPPVFAQPPDPLAGPSVPSHQYSPAVEGPPISNAVPAPLSAAASPTVISGPSRTLSSRPALIALIASGAVLILGIAATVVWWASGSSRVASAPPAPVASSAQPAPRPVAAPPPTTPAATAAPPAKASTPPAAVPRAGPPSRKPKTNRGKPTPPER
jgi:eukaryotic-like serine/threonine-protein kinase